MICSSDGDESSDECSPVVYRSEAWEKVQVTFHGPLIDEKFLCIVRDVKTNWINALSLPSQDVDGQVGRMAANFIFEQLCTFGFARVVLENNQFTNKVVRILVELWDTLKLKNVKFENFIKVDEHGFQDQMEKNFVKKLQEDHQVHWEEHLQSSLFQHRISFHGSENISPFRSMFHRHQISSLSSYMLRKRVRQVADGAEDHSEEEVAWKVPRRTKKLAKKVNREKVTTNNSQTKRSKTKAIEEKEMDEMKNNAVTDIKALLTATREERMKRGKYFKYTPELRDEIAEYAIEHGISAATEYFSGQLDAPVKGSSVRNFIKSYNSIPSQVKENIGKFAHQFGFDMCVSKFLNQRIGDSVLEKGVLKRCLQFYKRRFPHFPENDQEMWDKIAKVKAPFPPSLKDEIGIYASQNAIEDTVGYFSERLGFPVMQSTVLAFRDQYLSRNLQGGSHVKTQQPGTSQIITLQMQSMPSDGTAPISFIQQGSSQIIQSNYPAQANPTQTTTLILNQSPPNAAATTTTTFTQIVPIAGSYNQHPIVVQPTPPSTSQTCHNQQQISFSSPVSSGQPLSLTINTVNSKKEENPEPKSVNLSKSKSLEGKPSRKTTSTKDVASRGRYANYSPDMRAKIAKYALDHGNQEAINYFMNHHGMSIPESTIRTIRDNYLRKVKNKRTKDIDRLDYETRGRPTSLGKYDAVVKKCILELVKSGEKVSSFLAIATAKRVLMEQEPTLLVENGGYINLNPVWAKSFLRRIKMTNKKT